MALCSAHVPRDGLRPPLLLYFAAQNAMHRRADKDRRAYREHPHACAIQRPGGRRSEVKEEGFAQQNPGDMSGVGHPGAGSQ
ncbi:hypothetical protein B0E41_13525 [Hydrogenophaga sp. A37]|nr:hypothetical protein B0E41_13525 [Hydrogenophaga sp. A37]